MKNRYFLTWITLQILSLICQGCARLLYGKDVHSQRGTSCGGEWSGHPGPGQLMLVSACRSGHGALCLLFCWRAEKGRQLPELLLSGALQCSKERGTEALWFWGLPPSLWSLICCVMHSWLPGPLTWDRAVAGYFWLCVSQRGEWVSVLSSKVNYTSVQETIAHSC